MRTAEEWYCEAGIKGCDFTALCPLFEAIQLDAWKQGMTDAAEIDKNYHLQMPETDYDSHESILTARDNKKEI